MKGWQIFVHSVRLVLNNIGAAFRISFVLYLVSAAAQVYGYMNADTMAEVETGAFSPEAIQLDGTTLFLSLLGLVASLWIAVAWHRFVLEEEYPTGFLPRMHGAKMLGYFGRSLLIGIIVMLGTIGAGFILGVVAFLAPPLGLLIFPVSIGLGAVLFFRLGSILPACAVGQKLSLNEAWAATRGEATTFVVLGVIITLATLVIFLPSLINSDPASVINLIYVLVVNWFATIIGISLLTTVYGHFIQGRPID
ncbi:hypothetical protein [Primorskyibacter sedentarius]|uniref:hypothetical protein n=1 Tax=Primorskyibacter sedentarius TaxID=745311 RepID=UPI003EBA1F86